MAKKRRKPISIGKVSHEFSGTTGEAEALLAMLNASFPGMSGIVGAEASLRSLMPNDQVTDDEMNRNLYMDIKRSIDKGQTFERPEDDYGTVANFLVSFITKDMRRSFPEIAEQFLQHENFLKDPTLIPDSEAKEGQYPECY